MALSDVALVLGPVVFRGFEVPERINFGGDQRIAVHELPGGQRVIDTLGATSADITWSGVFTGADATARARLLDTLRVQGAALTLSWDAYFYSVVLHRFEASYRNAAWVPYRLTVSVLYDQAQVLQTVLDDFATDVLGDVGAASGFAFAGGVDLSPLSTSFAASGATVLNTAAYVGAEAALAGGQSRVQTAFDGANAMLGAYAGSTNAVGVASGGVSNANDVAGMIGAAGAAAQLSASAAYLGRVAANMNNAST